MVSEVTGQEPLKGIVVIDIGNTSTHLGAWNDGLVSGVRSVATGNIEQFASMLAELSNCFELGKPEQIAVSSVVSSCIDPVLASIKEVTGIDAKVVGRDVPLPIHVDVPLETVGTDRVCSAAAAFNKTDHACAVIDFGTAITVDLVGDNGHFLGGAILPGASMQAWVLNEKTSALPLVDPLFPESPLGSNTQSAINSGICYGIAGAVRGLVEGLAVEAGSWPQTVATGGDLEQFLPYCDFIDSAVPDLCLMGVGLALQPGAEHKHDSCDCDCGHDHHH